MRRMVGDFSLAASGAARKSVIPKARMIVRRFIAEKSKEKSRANTLPDDSAGHELQYAARHAPRHRALADVWRSTAMTAVGHNHATNNQRVGLAFFCFR